MFFFALRRFISRTRKTAPTKGRTHRQTKPRLLFVIYILSHLIFIVNCFSPQKKIIFGRLCSSSHIIVAYYSRIISRSGKTYAIFFAGRADIRPIHPQKTHIFIRAYPTNIRLLPFFYFSFGSCRFTACRRCRFFFHSALAFFPHAAVAALSFIRLLPFSRMPLLPFFLSFGSCRFTFPRNIRGLLCSLRSLCPLWFFRRYRIKNYAV